MQSKLDNFVMDVPTKVILCLFEVDSQPIRGKQFMVNQMFLVSQEVVPDASKYFEWYPYQYGPYSTILANRMNRMMEIGYVKTEKIKGVWAFSMTPEGQAFLNAHLNDENAVYDLWEVQNLSGYDEDLMDMAHFVEATGSKNLNEWLRAKYPVYYSQTRD